MDNTYNIDFIARCLISSAIADEAEDRSALVELVDGGAKNRWKITIPATLPTGFTATFDTDGGLILNGTTGETALTFVTFTQFHAGETVVLSGCPAGGSDDSYRLDILRGNNTNYCYGDPVIASGFAETTYQVRIRIAANYTCNNLKFFPMICTKVAWDISHAYQPYRPSYQELYEMVQELQAQLGDISIKKITKEEYDSIVHDENTIYYVRDGDKIIQYIGGGRVGSSTSGLMKMKSLNTQYSRQFDATFRNFE